MNLKKEQTELDILKKLEKRYKREKLINSEFYKKLINHIIYLEHHNRETNDAPIGDTSVVIYEVEFTESGTYEVPVILPNEEKVKPQPIIEQAIKNKDIQ